MPDFSVKEDPNATHNKTSNTKVERYSKLLRKEAQQAEQACAKSDAPRWMCMTVGSALASHKADPTALCKGISFDRPVGDRWYYIISLTRLYSHGPPLELHRFIEHTPLMSSTYNWRLGNDPRVACLEAQSESISSSYTAQNQTLNYLTIAKLIYQKANVISS